MSRTASVPLPGIQASVCVSADVPCITLETVLYAFSGCVDRRHRCVRYHANVNDGCGSRPKQADTASGNAQNKEATHVEQAQEAENASAGQLKQHQRTFLRFKDLPAQTRSVGWPAFEAHVKKHGQTPSTRSLKARCIMLKLHPCPEGGPHHMHAIYVDS
jgi:hypothetical protein